MKRIRQILISTLTVSLLSTTAMAQSGFNPTPPSEPGQTAIVILGSEPEDAGRQSGGGKYAVGTTRSINTTPSHAKWKFVNWTNDDSNTVISNSSSIKITWVSGITHLTSHYEETDTFKVVAITNTNNSISTSGTGTYAYTESSYTRLSAGSKYGYTFLNWTRKGQIISTQQSFNYYPSAYGIKNACDTIVANYTFSPTAPAEPDADKARISRYVNVTSTPVSGGYTNFTQRLFYDGDNVTLTAYNYPDYKFVSWTQNDIVVSYDKNYSFRMGKKDLSFIANFEYAPGTPSEPETVVIENYGVYAGTANIYIGQTTMLPISLENTSDVDEVKFRITLPDAFTIDNELTEMSNRMNDATCSINSTIIKDSIQYDVTIENTGYISYNNGVIVNLCIDNGEKLAEVGTYTLSIYNATVSKDGQTSSIPVSMHDGTLNTLKPLPTGQKGDVNNDGKINGRDKVLIKFVMERYPIYQRGLEFDFENADMNDDGRIDMIDYQILLKLIKSLN